VAYNLRRFSFEKQSHHNNRLIFSEYERVLPYWVATKFVLSVWSEIDDFHESNVLLFCVFPTRHYLSSNYDTFLTIGVPHQDVSESESLTAVSLFSTTHVLNNWGNVNGSGGLVAQEAVVFCNPFDTNSWMWLWSWFDLSSTSRLHFF